MENLHYQNIYLNNLKKRFKVKKIDGDVFEKNKNKKKIFKKEILKNNYDIIKEVYKIQQNYNFILISVISPFLETKNLQEKFQKRYFEINVSCKLKTLIKRDTKGLYKKALEKNK